MEKLNFVKILILFTMIFTFFFVGRHSIASEKIAGSILKKGERELVITIRCQKPCPNIGILTLVIPKDMKIITSRPKLASFNNKTSSAKWLINPVAQEISIHIQFDKNIDNLSEYHAFFQYKESSSDSLKEIRLNGK